jgi:FixJ family two-component response regulator
MENGALRHCALKLMLSGDGALARQRVVSIIDDDDSVRESTARLVRSLGHCAAVFSSAEEYLRSDRIGDCACVITDLHMRGMSGADLQDRLIAEGYRTPVIFITAHFEENARARALHTGAFGFLRKPFADESLIACLDEALKDSDNKSA